MIDELEGGRPHVDILTWCGNWHGVRQRVLAAQMAIRYLALRRDQQFVVNPNGIPELLEELSQCPAHRVTPLFTLPGLAERLGVGEVRVKDE
ncbi:MAG: hypothetical protein NTY38_11095, partial [Acidobacteria bacterium]|nr:hypothetical protein [Acidobacteriota bacterium]